METVPKTLRGDFELDDKGEIVFVQSDTGKWQVVIPEEQRQLSILQQEKLSVLSDLQHNILKQHGNGNIKTVEGMLRCISYQVFIMQSEIRNQL